MGREERKEESNSRRERNEERENLKPLVEALLDARLKTGCRL